MTPREFILKWRENALTEKSAAHQHFLDICDLVGADKPAEVDPKGEFYTFEPYLPKTGGGNGFADVWYRGRFAWEYKKRKRDLDAAMKQLADYSAALDNPPIHVACDTIKFRIETRWTNTVTKKWEFELEDLMDDRNLAVLRAVLTNVEALRPTETRASLTREAADKFQTISDRLQNRYADRKEAVAHFVNQLVFCFFADSVKLLPPGQPSTTWKRLLLRATENPATGNANLATLFRLMAERPGGEFALETIRWFNGKLFDGRPPLTLDRDDFHLLLAAATVKWDLIDPTIFGTLFERFLDPDKRAQIGAHYTDAEKIMLIVEPVILRPLRAEWAAARAEIDAVLAKGGKAALANATAIRDAFLERLRTLSILDPACGSGNFLYLALQHVKDLELKAIRECEPLGLDRVRPEVSPRILKGLEINPFAAELARAVIWIGDLQWEIRNDLLRRTDPVLEDLDQIECRDALVSRIPHPEPVEGWRDAASAEGSASTLRQAQGEADGAVGAWVEAPWPEAEFIVGNPPFLGAKLMKRKLGIEQTSTLRRVYSGRLSGFSDLVCYWFEKAHAEIEAGRTKRVGLVSTSSIRGGTNRPVMDRISKNMEIYNAWDELPWTVDGAKVEVSLVCFTGIEDKSEIYLNGHLVEKINADLSVGVDLTKAKRLYENSSCCFVGVQLSGPHDVSGEVARNWLKSPLNPNLKPNADVLCPYSNGDDITGWNRDKWVIDIPMRLSGTEAALFEEPFNYLYEARYDQKSETDRRSLKEARQTARDSHARERWWEAYWPRPELRRSIAGLERYMVTPEVAQFRNFVWLSPPIVPDKNLTVFARDDDTTFGILHSRFHEAWSLRLGTSLEDRPRYTPTTTFETFPFPEGLTPNIPAADYAADPRAIRIAAAAAELDRLRRNWLHPADLGDWVPEITPTAAPGEAPRRYPDRFQPKTVEAQAKLKERTLTNLYNQRPQWLASAHEALDRAVAAAYGWPEDIAVEEALAKLLALNLERAAAGG